MQQTMRTLGHHLDDDAGIASCFNLTTAAMLRSFYGNLSKGLQRASENAKFRFLRSSVQSVAEFRWTRWPFQKAYADRLDRLQRKMLSSMFEIKPKPEEPYDAFVQRRHIKAGHLASRCGRWSHAWANSVLTWDAHLTRRHDTMTWSPLLVNWHDSSWLTLQRLLHSIGFESRTRTRAYKGKVHRRWQESIEDARRLAS